MHELDALIDGHLEKVLDAQRCAARGKPPHRITARHSLAVMLSILAQESLGDSRLEYWREALKTWRELIDDERFWTSMREHLRKTGTPACDSVAMRVAVCRQLSLTFSEAILDAVRQRKFHEVPPLARVAMEHRSWLNADAALAGAGRQILYEGFVALKEILDHLSRIALADEEANIRNSLGAREKELRAVAAEHGALVRSLGELADGEGWENAVAASKQRLAAAYLDLLDDPHEGVRVISHARELAHEPKLMQSIKRDWQHMQRAVFCRDAHQLTEQGDMAGADRKLVAALALSTEEEKAEIGLMQAHNRRKRECEEQSRRRAQRVTLCREAHALCQAGEFARAEYKLSAALAVCCDEDHGEVKELLDRCRWARVLRTADTTRKKPFLFSLNGIGARFYGGRAYDLGTDSYVTTHWLTFLFVPVFPLGAYRVTGAHQAPLEVHGKVALPSPLATGRWGFAACLLFLVLWSGLQQQKYARGGLTARVLLAPRSASPAVAVAPAGHAQEDDRAVSERAELAGIGRSLQDRRKKLALENVDLEKQQGYLRKVASAYAGEKVPAGGSVFEDMVLEYTRRRAEYEKKRAGLNAEFIAYYDRARRSR